MFNSENKTHYKMYKAGKRWLFGAITVTMFTAGIAGGTLLSNGKSVHADTAVNTTQNQDSSTANADAEKTQDNSDQTKATKTDSTATNDATDKVISNNSTQSVDENTETKVSNQTDEPKQTNTDKSVNSQTDSNKSDKIVANKSEDQSTETDKKTNDQTTKIAEQQVAPENDLQNATEDATKTQSAETNLAVSDAQQPLNVTFTDPDYAAAGVPFTDPDADHYTFGYYDVNRDNGQQSNVKSIIVSTDRNGDGIVYYYELDANNNVLDKIILNDAGTSYDSKNITNLVYSKWDKENVGFYFPDDVEGDSKTGNPDGYYFYKEWTYDSPEKNLVTKFGQTSTFVPEKVTQKITWINKDTNKVMAEHSYDGIAGQHYDVTGMPPEIPATYYISAKPLNASGIVSNFGVPGTVWTKHYKQNSTMTYTETDDHGGMDVQFFDANGNPLKSATWDPSANNGKGGLVPYSGPDKIHIDADYQFNPDNWKYTWAIPAGEPGVGSYTLGNIYVPQSRNIVFYVAPLGKLVPTYDGNPIDNGTHDEPYKINPNDPTKAQQPTIPNIPGYVPIDPNDPSKVLTPGDPSPVPVDDPGKDTTIPYVIDKQTATITYVDQNGNKVLHTDDLSGKIGEHQDYSTDAELAELSKQGYSLVSSDVPTNGITLDYNSGKPLAYTVVVNKVDEEATVTYIDDTTGNVIPDSPVTTLTGKAGQAIDKSDIEKERTYLESKGYVYVNDDVPADFSTQNNQKYTVHFIHGTSQVTDNSGKGTLTVTYVYEDGKSAAADVTKEVGFTRTGTEDKVTGNIVWNKWNPNGETNVSINSPVIEGYTPNQQTVKDDIQVNKNDTAKVVYTANAEKAHVQYVDQDDNNAVLHSDDLDGKFGDKANYSTKEEIAALEAKGYELVTDGYPVDGYTYTTEDPTFTVVLKHKTKTVTPDNPGTPGQPVDPDNPTGPKYPDGTSEQDVVKDITRTIHYKYADGTEASKDVTEQVKYTRNVTFDEVTGKIISSTAWASENPDYAEVTSPVIPGFVADQPVVGEAATKSTDENSEVTVHYNAAAEKATVNYVDQDDNNAVLHSDDLDGKFGDKANYSTKEEIAALEAKGYELVTDGYPVDGYTYTTEDPTFTVVLKHKTKTVTPDNPGTPGQPVDPDNPTGPKYPDGTSEQDVVKDITRTIHYKYADGTEASKDVTEQVKYTRNVTFDEVTGKIISSTAWASENPDYAEVTSPVIPGFVADQPVVGEAATKSTDENSEVTVHYNAAAEKATVNYVDQDDNNAVLHSDALNGKFGDKANYSTKEEIAALEAQGYELVTDGYPVDGYTYTTEEPTFTVVLKHKTKTVTPDNPGTPGQPVDPDNPTGPKYPDGTSEQDVVKDITRTIHYKYADGTEASKDVSEQVKYTRNVTFDEVTGKIISSTAWASENPDYAEVTSPVIPGFVADQPVVGEAATKSTDENSEVTVHYNAAAEKATVNYVDQDDNNAVLHSDALNGKFGDKANYSTKEEIAALESQGYELVTDGYPVDGYTYTTEEPTFTVVLKHKTKTVTPDNPGTPGQPVDPDNPTGPKYPDGTSEQDVVKDITRTIHYKYADGTEASKDVSEQVKYTRNVTFDEVTGKIISSTAWASENPDYAEVTSPVIPGFVADQPVVGEAATKSTDENSEVTVHYNAAAEKATVNYVDQDDNNAVLHSDALNGKFGNKANYSTKEEIAALESQGYELVTDGYPVDGYTYTTEDPTFTVVLKHKTKTVTPDNPGTPGQPVDPDNPTGPKYPDGTGKQDIVKDVTRIIHYKDDQGNEVAKDVDQSTTFSRDATFDEVTGKIISYGNWNPADDNFGAVNSPVITGYYADTATVAAEKVSADTSDSEVTVVYRKLGNLIPEVPGGTPVPYPNDPTDPTKPSDPVIPDYPGYIPMDPNGTPLTPGNTYPIDKNHPGQDTPLPYVAAAEKATVNYVDQDNNDSLIKSDALDGKFGEKSGYTTKNEIAALEAAGYELVSDGYPTDGYTFTTEDPTFTVVLKHKTKMVTPDNPGTPGQPIDPDNPTGPKYPDGTGKQDIVKDVTRTIHYIDDQGNVVSKEVTESATFGRNATFDEVTGKIISYGNWTPTDGTLAEVNSPVITGYYTDTAKVDAENVTADSKNSDVNVVYHKLGNLVPDVPGSNPVPYPNLPGNPSDSGNPIIPDIPGYTPVDNNGNKLVPGTPYPINHNDLGKDTPLHYVKNEVPVTPSTPETPDVPETPVTPSTPEVPATPAEPKAPEKPTAQPEAPQKDVLPQTGQDATASLMSIIGTILLSILGFFGLDGFRKRKEDK